MKKTLQFLFFLIFFVLFFKVESVASTKLDGIENFPESYKPFLYELKKNHPNWEFTALYTNLDWQNCINEEYANDKNLVPISYEDAWKCKDSGKYNVEIDLGWVNASRNAVEYVMDPRNFLNEVRIFQFEKLTYDPNVNTKEGIEKILYGTEFYNKIVIYKDQNGNEITTNSKYSDLIWDAAIYSGVSPYHLASRIKQEVGPFLSHNSISGTVSGYEGLYNFYNIGASSSSEPLGAIKNGLEYAKNGKNSISNEERINQLIPWNTKERAIKGGAVFIGKKYITAGQNTIYLQKFNVNNESANSLFWHQYMTNCLAPYSESKSIYTAYLNSGLLNSSIGFLIPVYENMPQYSTDRPSISTSDYINDNTKVYADVTGNLNVRVGPSTSYEIVAKVNRDATFTRIKKGIQNGERWDKVVLENGIVGYVFQSYLKEIPQSIENTGNEDQEDRLEFDNRLIINGNEISNLNIENLKVSEIKGLIDTNMNLEFLNSNNTILTDDNKIGTGTRLIVKDKNNNSVYEYKFILYGDVNGDGEINSLDVLVLQKHILEIKILKDEFLKVANISRTGDLPTSLDVLKIQKHILEIKQIEQGETQGLTSNRIIDNLQEKAKDNESEEDTNKANDVEIKNNLEVNNDLENNLENNIDEENDLENNLENNIFEKNENFINEKIDSSNENENSQYSEENDIQNQEENNETENMEKDNNEINQKENTEIQN